MHSRHSKHRNELQSRPYQCYFGKENQCTLGFRYHFRHHVRQYHYPIPGKLLSDQYAAGRTSLSNCRSICTVNRTGTVTRSLLRNRHHWTFHGSPGKRIDWCRSDSASSGKCICQCAAKRHFQQSVFLWWCWNDCRSAFTRRNPAGCNHCRSATKRLHRANITRNGTNASWPYRHDLLQSGYSSTRLRSIGSIRLPSKNRTASGFVSWNRSRWDGSTAFPQKARRAYQRKSWVWRGWGKSSTW